MFQKCGLKLEREYILILHCYIEERRKIKMKKLITKYGMKLCALAVLFAPVALQSCRTVFYEMEEPEGLEKFASKNK